MTSPSGPLSGPDTLLLGGDLAGALAAGELQLYYEPVVHLATGVAVGAEAAPRWFTARRGVVTAEDVIALAERSGMGAPLGEAVLRAACRDAAMRAQSTDGLVATPSRPALWVAVDATPGMLVASGRFGLVSTVERALVASGLEPHLLTVEIDEAVAARVLDRVAVVCDQLRRLGVRVVLDGFGREFGALTFMSRLPLDGVKVAPELVDALPAGGAAADTLHGVAAVARDVGLVLGAAGIASRTQLSAARNAGAALGQGNIFAPPAPIGVLDRTLGLESEDEYQRAYAEAAATHTGYGYRLGDLPPVDAS